MKVKDIPTGTIFNIEHTPSYPKLKLEVSYIDMRDRIIGTPSITDEKDAYVMETGDLLKQFPDATFDELNDWINEVKVSVK